MTVSTVCSQEDLEQAGRALRREDAKALGRVSDRIRQMKGYENDPNCLYVLLADAKQRLDQGEYIELNERFKLMYDRDKGLNEVLRPIDTTIAGR